MRTGTGPPISRKSSGLRKFYPPSCEKWSSKSQLMNIQTTYSCDIFLEQLYFLDDLSSSFGIALVLIAPPFFRPISIHPAGGQSLGSADPTRAAESGNQRLRLAAGLGLASQCQCEFLGDSTGNSWGLRPNWLYRMVTLATFGHIHN